MKYAGLAKTGFRLLLKLQQPNRQEGGYILVIVMGLVLVMSGLFLTTGLTSKVDKASGKALEEDTTGFSAAEAGLNLRAQDIRAKFIGYNRPAGTSPTGWADCRDSSGAPVTSGAYDFRCISYDGMFKAIVDRENAATLADKQKDIKVSTYVNEFPNNPKKVTIPPGEPFAGLNAQEYRYDVTSVAYSNQLISGQSPRPSSILTMSFKSRLVPLFQFAAFYENDLDFTRPAQMTLHGPIHTNSSMYLNASAPISIYGQLSSSGKMYRGEKVAGESCNTGFKVHDPYNTLNIAVADNLVEIPCNGSRAEITADSSYNSIYVGGGSAVNNWNQQIRPKIPRLVVPASSFLDAKLPDVNNTYEYWNKADLRLALRLTNDSAEEPASIEVVNADVNKTTNTVATNALNGSTCNPDSSTLQNNNTGSNQTGTGNNGYTQNATKIAVADTTKFPQGTALRITGSGFDDFDENVVTSRSTPSGAGILTLARPLGKNSISNPAGFTVSKAVVWTSKTFYNYREKAFANTNYSGWNYGQKGRLIRMLNVDMQGLLTCAGSNLDLMGGRNLDDLTDGGLVWHFTVLGPKSENDVTKTPTPDEPNNYGIRVYNGKTLASKNAGHPPIKGLTLASDQVMYVRGDYNCTWNAATKNCDNKKPAAIMADTMNVLSNNSTLDDIRTCGLFDTSVAPNAFVASNTAYDTIYNATTCNRGNLSVTPKVSGATNQADRVAIETSIAAAFLAGVDIPGTNNNVDPATSANDGSNAGGVNNYTRLHENWSGGINFNYRGSMVSLGKGRRVNGPFSSVGGSTSSNTVGGQSNVYSAPTRNWDYDTDFNDAAKLPPLTPRFVFLRQERFSRDYQMQSARPMPFSLASIFPGNFVSMLPISGHQLFRF